MKKTVLFKFPFLSVIIAGFFLVAFTNSAQAQVKSTVVPKDQLYEVPVENFVSPQLALTILANELDDLKEELASLTEGSAAYRTVLAQWYYFDAIRTNILDGKTVAVAIVEGFRAIGADEYQLTVQTLQEFKDQAIYFLKG